MSPDTPNLEQLLDAFPEEFITLDPQGQDVAIALYRLLAGGAPVSHRQLAQACALAETRIDELLVQWLGVHHDEAGEVTGFLGLTVNETAHRLRVDGRDLYAWCAWDTLFLPGLIGRPAEVSSRCAQSGAEIRLALDPARVVSLTPDTTVLSFVTPDEQRIREDVIGSFCQSVLFLASAALGEQWLARHPGCFLMSVAQAFELAQMINRRKFPRLTA